jgi:tRNA threonylcarbamoyladenosine biosynthesis protein TsaE
MTKPKNMKGTPEIVVSVSEEETRRLGTILGKHITAPLVVLLMGELGAGKTCLTQGLARGLDVPNSTYVTSPSYALINEYSGRVYMYHIDLYRLEDPSEFDDIGLDEILTSESVSVIEWAERLGSALPKNRLEISIEIMDATTRHLHIAYHGNVAKQVVSSFLEAI